MLVFTQLEILLEQALQPFANRQPRVATGQADPQGDTVDEQPDGILHFRSTDRPPGDGNTEQYVVQAAVATQHERPSRLGQGIDGEMMLLGQFAQATPLFRRQVGVAVANDGGPALPVYWSVER